MSKGMNRRKQTRKAPVMTMMEKRAAKRAKKGTKGAMHNGIRVTGSGGATDR